MKIDARRVRFQLPLPRPGRRRMEFVGKENTLQLLETAVVIEGYQRQLWMPVVDRFFRRILSEWTTVTIPYARVLRCRYERFLVARALLTALVWAFPVLLLLSRVAKLTGRPDESLIFPLLLVPFAAVLTMYIHQGPLRPGNYLLFRRADGRRVAIAFRIPSRKLQAAFQERLKSNRQAAARAAADATGAGLRERTGTESRA